MAELATAPPALPLLLDDADQVEQKCDEAVTTAALDDLREAVTTLEETTRTMRRVLGGAHPSTARIEEDLRNARAALSAREGTQALGSAK